MSHHSPRPPRFRYLVYLFDADGPLLDTVDISFTVTNRVLESFDLPPLEKEEWHKQNKRPERLYLNSGLLEENLKEAFRRYNNAFNELQHTTTSPVEVETTLKALNSMRVGVVTDMPRTEWDYYDQRFRLGNYVQVVITRDDCPERKPLPNPLILAMKNMGFERKKIAGHVVRGLMVGDSPKDIIAGRNAGMDTAALFYRGSYSNKENLLKCEPTYLIPDLYTVTNIAELRRHQVNDSLFAK